MVGWHSCQPLKHVVPFIQPLKPDVTFCGYCCSWLTLAEPPFWRGSGCALPVMAAAQIRRFCMPADPAEFPSFPPVPHAGAASITSPTRLTRRATRPANEKRPGVVTACGEGRQLKGDAHDPGPERAARPA
jgi:hypothetical protein